MIEAREADQLATRARRGDAAALVRLYDAFAPALLAYLKRQLGDRDNAEDALQETFLHLIDERVPFRPCGLFRAWLFSVAANAARDHRRREASHQRALERFADDRRHDRPPASDRPDDALAARQALAGIESALGELPRDYAVAFHLRLREGFSFREIAAITGEPEGTLRSRVHHALRRLRSCLAHADDAPNDRERSHES